MSRALRALIHGDETAISLVSRAFLRRAFYFDHARHRAGTSAVLGPRLCQSQVVRNSGLSWPCFSRNSAPLARGLSESLRPNVQNTRTSAGPFLFVPPGRTFSPLARP